MQSRQFDGLLRAGKRYAGEWAASDGLVWLHLLKTATAALLALGIAMRLELSQPRTAMATVFVLMQPMTGMVLAKSFYRALGTATGMVAAIVLGALFAQEAGLYMAAITCWVATCTALAVRFRHFQWYAFVLAGYTAVLIGIPVVSDPNSLFIAALTRAAEVTVGILCSSAVSALILPVRVGTALLRTLRDRHLNLTDLAADVLAQRIERSAFQDRFLRLADGIAGFEATRTFASFEDPGMRARSRRFARINSEYSSACTRLHALHQLVKRLDAAGSALVTGTISCCLAELPGMLDRLHNRARDSNAECADIMADITAMELLDKFVTEFISYQETYMSLAEHNHALERSATKHQVKTNPYVISLTFLRTFLAVGAIGVFWLATGWPSGGLAVIGAAITCALTSTSPNPSKVAVQIAVGTVLATAVGYAYTCYVYPNIDGFALLCVALAPIAACGAFLASRSKTAGYGVGFGVFFCILAAPDNEIVYAPDVLLNNGVAVVVSMLVSAAVSAIVFPAQMPWLVEKIQRDLRRQVTLACNGSPDRLSQRFQSGTHDLVSQLHMLLTPGSKRHSDALRWMLATLEVGHAAIDLRNQLLELAGVEWSKKPRWVSSIDSIRRALSQLFDQPNEIRLGRALTSVNRAIRSVQRQLDEGPELDEQRYKMQRILSQLHFIRSVLVDKDAPFHVQD